MQPSRINPQDLDAELARLGELSLDALKARHENLVGTPLPKYLRPAFAQLVVGHALQSQELGGFDRDTRQQLDRLVAEIVPIGAAQPRPKNRKLRTGTRLIREWQGRVHEVVVTAEGYRWNDHIHGSLTEIARAITGTNWNGWVFFGIKKKPALNAAARRPAAQAEAAYV